MILKNVYFKINLNRIAITSIRLIPINDNRSLFSFTANFTVLGGHSQLIYNSLAARTVFQVIARQF